eukprot:362630-Chlamydomonas_euryale.AAC.1
MHTHSRAHPGHARSRARCLPSHSARSTAPALPPAPPPALCAAALTLSSALPMNLATLMTGAKRLNSLHQLPSVDLGTMTMWGPVMPRYSYRYATRLIVCSVLPRPWNQSRTRTAGAHVCVCGDMLLFVLH